MQSKVERSLEDAVGIADEARKDFARYSALQRKSPLQR